MFANINFYLFNLDDVTRLLHEKILYALAKSDNKDFMLFANKAYSQRLDKKIPADLQKAVILL